MAGGIDQVTEHPPRKYEALSSNLNTSKIGEMSLDIIQHPLMLKNVKN
jgi:hypothetical protein